MPPVVFLCTDRKAVKFENNSLDLECAQGCIVMCQEQWKDNKVKERSKDESNIG